MLARLAMGVLVAMPASAITYVLPTDESLVDRTRTIVYGRVLSAAPAPEGLPLPATDFTFQVEEVLKGAVPRSTVTVRQLGGSRRDGLAMRVSSLPRLQEGRRALLFLSKRQRVYRTVDFALGIFFETGTESRDGSEDRSLLERAPSLREDVFDVEAAGNGNADADADADRTALLGPRDSALFRAWIRDRAAGVSRPTDYFVAESEIVRSRRDVDFRTRESVVVTSSYRFSRTDSDCVYSDYPIRWTEFEQGEFVAFSLQEGGQPGLSDAATRQAVNNAMYAWNIDADSRVNLRYYRDAVSPETSEYRGWNLIMFDDPLAEGDPLIPGEGGVLAWAQWWYQCNSPPVSRPPPYDSYSDVRIAQSDIVTAKDLGAWLQWLDSSAVRTNLEEILAHELGHSLGFAHPCGDEASGDCTTTATDEAIMRAQLHLDRRGASLSSDDRAIVRQLYPEPASDSPPRAPTDVSVVPTNSTTVRITWEDRSHNEDGFQVWRRLEGAGWTADASTPANVEQAHAIGLQPGGTYEFFVRAFHADGHADSDRAAVTMPRDKRKPPTAPVNVSVVPTNSTTVRITWRDRSHNEDGFQVWRRLEGAGWTVDASTPANVEQAHAIGLQPGGTYEFFVRAFHADGHADSGRAAVTMPRDKRKPPTAPVNVSVVPTNSTTVRITWRDRSHNEDGFQVWRRFEGAGWTVDASTPANVEQAHVSDLEPGGRYQFFVRAFHADGHADSGRAAVTMPRDKRKPPTAPVNVSVVPTNSTTVHVTWRDRSHNEDGFQVRRRLEGADWTVDASTPANVEQAHVSGLQPGGRYQFLVRAFHADGHADSDPVTVISREPGTLQASQFRVGFSAEANGSTVTGQWAGWLSDKGVLYWLFDPQNPEALVKVLDGRSWNEHWWLDLAVASDLPSVTRVIHRETGDEWVAVTGFGKDVYREPGESANRLVHCAYPASRADSRCAVSGYGTTVSLRDAWDASGRIPSSHFPAFSASVDAVHLSAQSARSADLRRQRFVPAANSRGQQGLADTPLAAALVPTVAGDDVEPATLQRSQFGIHFSARANDSTVIGESGWSSDKGVLYWLFDPQNPEALVKVLDGRSWNEHWWLDLAVASDLPSVTRVIHRETGDEWVAVTGFGKDVYREPGESANRLVHCAYPASRADSRCAVSGHGTTVSLRDAWDASGRIPSRYHD